MTSVGHPRTASRPVHDVIPCQVTGLSVAYHDRLALRNVTLDVPPGAVMAVLGPNGAGKSAKDRKSVV